MFSHSCHQTPRAGSAEAARQPSDRRLHRLRYILCKVSSASVTWVHTSCRKVTDSSEILMLGGCLAVCLLCLNNFVVLKCDTRLFSCWCEVLTLVSTSVHPPVTSWRHRRKYSSEHPSRRLRARFIIVSSESERCLELFCFVTPKNSQFNKVENRDDLHLRGWTIFVQFLWDVHWNDSSPIKINKDKSIRRWIAAALNARLSFKMQIKDDSGFNCYSKEKRTTCYSAGDTKTWK